VVFRPFLLALFLSIVSFGYSDDLNPEESSLAGGLSENYRTRMNKNTEVFVKDCDNPSPPLFDPNKWCSIPEGWNSNPGDIQNGKIATEIWQATGRCATGYKFSSVKSKCVPAYEAACTWGQKLNPPEKTCEPLNAEDASSPNCEISGFNTEKDGSGEWFKEKIPISIRKVFAYVTCKKKQELPFISICNLKNATRDKQTNWYKCAGPDPLTKRSYWIELNLSEISDGDKDNQIIFEIRGAYSKTPLKFHESHSKTFVYKI
jgi:hypothetical protein